MQIEVIQVNKTTKQGKTAYIMLEVAYKQLNGTYAGKLASKKLMSFAQPDNAYKGLVDAKPGDVFNIKSHKNMETGFIDWDDATQVVPSDGPNFSNQPVFQESAKTMTATKSTYETPEERAKKQVYIVKQSSLTAALKFAELNKEKPTVEGVLALAQELTDWVFFTQEPETEKVQFEDVPD